MVMVHAENSDCITWLTEELERAGRTAPYFHAQSRPQAVEREGTHRAITMSEIVDVPILLVHVSAADAVEQIRWGQGRGLRIFAETCPQYLVLTADHLDAPGFEGAKYVCSPPPRDVESQEAIWRGLRSGVFHVFSSDHAAFRFDHPEGKKRHGTEAPFRKVPNGVPGVETRLLNSADELVAVLAHDFSLDVPEAAGLWPRVAARHEVVMAEAAAEA